MKTINIIICVLMLTSFALVSDSWTLTKDSKVSFRIKGFLGSTVNGYLLFGEHNIHFDEGDPQKSNMNISIPVYTLNTGNEKRDKHLRTADFFDTAKYPAIVFSSTSFKKLSGTWYSVNGNLTIKSVTKPVAISFKFTRKEQKGIFEGTFKINRLDFGVGEKSIMMGDVVTIELNVSANIPGK